MHVESPHAPFVREANNAYTFEDYQAGYVKQLQGLNKKVLKLLTMIPQKDPNGAIILQGDHGTFMIGDLKEQQSFMFAVKNAPFGSIKSEQFFKQFIYGK